MSENLDETIPDEPAEAVDEVTLAENEEDDDGQR